jgi:predicted ATPase
MAAWLPLPMSDRRCAITQGPAELDPGVLGVAFLGMLRVLVAERPVLVSVDDLQWLDPPERSFLEFAARRLRREPVVLLLARAPARSGARRVGGSRGVGGRSMAESLVR